MTGDGDLIGCVVLVTDDSSSARLFSEIKQAGTGDDGDVAEGGLQIGGVAEFGPLIEDAAHTADHGVGFGIAEEVHLTDLLDQIPQLDDRAGVNLALVLLQVARMSVVTS